MKGFSDNGPIGISAEVKMELWSKQKKTALYEAVF